MHYAHVSCSGLQAMLVQATSNTGCYACFDQTSHCPSTKTESFIFWGVLMFSPGLTTYVWLGHALPPQRLKAGGQLDLDMLPPSRPRHDCSGPVSRDKDIRTHRLPTNPVGVRQGCRMVNG